MSDGNWQKGEAKLAICDTCGDTIRAADRTADWAHGDPTVRHEGIPHPGTVVSDGFATDQDYEDAEAGWDTREPTWAEQVRDQQEHREEWLDFVCGQPEDWS